MDGQMTLFDFLKPEYPDINSITEAEAAEIVGDSIGKTFKYNSFFEQWEVRIGRLKLSLSFDNYNLDGNTDRFIGVGYEKGTSGGGAPCDTIQQAVAYFNRKMTEGR